MAFHRRQKAKKRRFRIKCLILSLLLMGGVMAADAKLRPAVVSVAEGQANLYTVKAIQTAVYEELSAMQMGYVDLVHLTYSDEGTVTSLQADMPAMSKLQASVTQSIIQRILEFHEQRILLPVGTLTGNPFLSGRGPEVEIKLIPSSFLETQIRNEFDSQGINQTRHQVMLHVKMDVQAVLPGYSIVSRVDTDVCLAETVIVGLVPGAYTMVSDGTDPLAGMIQDYGAGE